MALTGDFPTLRKLVAELDGVRGLQRPITEAAEAGVQEQYTEDFAEQRDPYGKPWSATALGKAPVLIGETLELANPTVTGANLTVRVKPAPHWVYHQMGANHMAPRMVLPFTDGSLWETPISHDIQEVVLEHFATASK